MTESKTLAFPIVDEADQQTARTATLFRLFDIAARRGYDIDVFAYEGAVRVVLTMGDGPNVAQVVAADVQMANLERRCSKQGLGRAWSAAAKLSRIRSARWFGVPVACDVPVACELAVSSGRSRPLSDAELLSLPEHPVAAISSAASRPNW